MYRGFDSSIIQSEDLLDYDTTLEDWTLVRSPARAARRRSKGHKQNIRYYHPPSNKILHMLDGTIIMHPMVYQKLRDKLSTNSS